MRISVNKNEPSHEYHMRDLKEFMESHKDGEEDYFVVTDKGGSAIIFQFSYGWVLGCHRLFIYNGDYDGLSSFFAEDFQPFGEWLFEYLDKIFGRDYDILY